MVSISFPVARHCAGLGLGYAFFGAVAHDFRTCIWCDGKHKCNICPSIVGKNDDPSKGGSVMEIFEEIAGLNKLLHEPARLSIMTALANCEQADFLFLLRLIGLSKGNLSGHLSKLETATLVVITKRFVGKKPQTLIAITAKGREQVDAHWQQLDMLRQGTRKLNLDTAG